MSKLFDNQWVRVGLGIGIATTVILIAMIPVLPAVTRLAGEARITPGFDAALLARQPLAIKIHIAAAMTALALGTILMLRPKGVGLHKAMGWMWVAAMGTTAVSSLFITGLGGDHWSVIHLLSGWVIISLPMAIFAIRRRDLKRHSGAMTGMFWGGLIFTGLLTFIPGRLMWAIFLG